MYIFLVCWPFYVSPSWLGANRLEFVAVWSWACSSLRNFSESGRAAKRLKVVSWVTHGWHQSTVAAPCVKQHVSSLWLLCKPWWHFSSPPVSLWLLGLSCCQSSPAFSEWLTVSFSQFPPPNPFFFSSVSSTHELCSPDCCPRASLLFFFLLVCLGRMFANYLIRPQLFC